VIFVIVALVPVTYLFINRNLIHREIPRARWAKVFVACAWGAVYALLMGLILGPLGILIGIGVGIYVFLV